MKRRLFVAVAWIVVILAGASALLWSSQTANASPSGASARVGLAVESVSRWGRATPVNTSDSDARVCKTRPYDMIERI